MDEFGGPIVRDYAAKGNQREADRAMPVQFRYVETENPRTGEIEQVEYIKIWIDQKTIRDQPVRFDFDQTRPNPPDNIRWEEEYKKFKAGEDQTSGIPLEQIPVLTAAEKDHCRNAGFRNASQIALLPDAELHRLGQEGRKRREKVKNYLDAVNGEGHQLALKNKELEIEVKNQSELVKDLMQQVKQLQQNIETPAEPKRKGRTSKPPKQEESQWQQQQN